jgi:hypothetical protein
MRQKRIFPQKHGLTSLAAVPMDAAVTRTARHLNASGCAPVCSVMYAAGTQNYRF